MVAKITKIRVKFADNSEKELKTKMIFAIKMDFTNGIHFLIWENGVQSTKDVKTFLSVKGVK